MNQREYKEWKEKHEWEKWRWEFMRRNLEVRKDYQKVKELRKKAAYPPDYRVEKGNLVEYPYFSTPEGKKEREYCAKHDLSMSYFPDPDKRFDDLIGGKPEFDGERYIFTAKQAWGHLFARNLRPRSISFRYNPKNMNYVNIKIDFTKINSIAALKNCVSALLEKHSEKIMESEEAKEQKYMIDYEIILMVGELKEKQGLKDQEIAKKIDPNKFKENPQSATRNIGHLHKRYNELVNRGYKEITFP